MATPLNEQATPGFRYLKDLFPQSRGIGLNYYPFSAISSGLTPAWTATAGNNTVAQTVTISAGSAYLDGQLATLAAGVTLTVTPGTVIQGENLYHIFLNPSRRLVPIVKGASAPTTLLNGVTVANGDMYAVCDSREDYLIATEFYKRVGGAWQTLDPSFEAPPVPAQAGKNRTWGGNCSPVIASGNFSINSIEQKIYIGTKYPPYTNSNSMALLRDSASLHIATLSLFYNASNVLVPSSSSIIAINNLTNP